MLQLTSTSLSLQFYGFVEENLSSDHYVLTRLLLWMEELRGSPLPPARLQALAQAQMLDALHAVPVVRKGLPAQSLQVCSASAEHIHHFSQTRFLSR